MGNENCMGHHGVLVIWGMGYYRVDCIFWTSNLEFSPDTLVTVCMRDFKCYSKQSHSSNKIPKIITQIGGHLCMALNPLDSQKYLRSVPCCCNVAPKYCDASAGLGGSLYMSGTTSTFTCGSNDLPHLFLRDLHCALSLPPSC